MDDYQTLDMRNVKELGLELNTLIQQGVKDTQSVVERPLPHTLVITGKQFDSLQTDPDMRGFWSTQERIFVTPLNVMDVVIKE